VVATAVVGVLWATAAVAGDATPAGLWRTIDDASGKDRSLVRITETNGVYEGRVEQILTTLPGDDPNHLCRVCTGERKDQPIVGMKILWGLEKTGAHEWGDGEILDPKNGKIYRALARLEDDGRKMEVRGFIGFALLGRSQTWIRQE
jgi:uncharacterized protein (DUF2147 family)